MKYIIDIEDKPVEGLYRAKEFKTLVFDEFGLSKLEKYEEQKADSGYAQGMHDAWQAARKIACFVDDGGINTEDLAGVFGSGMACDIMRDYTAAEAIEKIREFEEAGSAICVGDEVTAEDGSARFIVTHIGYDISGIGLDGSVYAYLPDEIDGKTGVHYCITETLSSMPFTKR